MLTGIPKLERRIAELAAVDVDRLTEENYGDVLQDLYRRTDDTLTDVFGANTDHYQRYSIPWLDDSPMSMIGESMSVYERRPYIKRGIASAISTLKSAVSILQERLAEAGPAAQPAPATPAIAAAPSRDVFIVHGQDGPAKIEVTHFIERAGLNPIVLHEQANGGKTIIEKFEKHGGAAGYAVVLMTPDDLGGPAAGPMKPRARQNVIGEMFWFSGKLGRSRVAALRKGDVEIPSDLHGIVYIAMDDHGGWKPKLLKELAEAGYALDWEKALK